MSIDEEDEGRGSALPLLVLLACESLRHKWKLVLAFVLISSAAVGLGISWPDSYSTSMTVYVEQQNVVETLMKGRAERPDISNWARNAREIIFNRAVLMNVARRTDRIEPGMPPAEVERQLDELRWSTEVSNPGYRLIRISHRGATSEGVYETTRAFGESLIERFVEARERESTAAFEFIDQQAKTYKEQLERAKAALERLREENPLARKGVIEELGKRQGTLRNRIGDLRQQLREAKIRAESLQQRLSGEADTSIGSTREDSLSQRIAKLRGELETLRLSYRDEHPDIVRLKRQIASLQEQLESGANSVNDDAGSGAGASGSPPDRELRAELESARIEIRTLESRLQSQREKLAEAQEQEASAREIGSEIDRLERDYRVNRDIYEDMLRRRENARVSQKLDQQQDGLTVRIQEHPYLPQRSSRPRLLHVAVGGGVIGILAPVGLLFVVLTVDPRIRLATQLPSIARSTLIGQVPHALSRRQLWRRRWSLAAAILVALLAVAGLAVLMWLETMGANLA